MHQMITVMLSGMLAFSAPACVEQAEVPAHERAEAAAPETMSQTEDTDVDFISITAGGQEFTATLYGNETAKTFAEQLPLTVTMEKLNGNEKNVYLDESLPTAASNLGKIQAGDIMLYGSSCLVVFYEDFPTSYSYTPIGRVTDADGLAEALGKGDISIAFTAGK